MATEFKIYIGRVLKQVHPETGISGAALATVSNLVVIDIKKIMFHVQNLMTQNKRKTLSSREIQAGVRLSLPGELAKHAVSEGTKAVTKSYVGQSNYSTTSIKPIMSRSTRAGLQFSVPRVEAIMKKLSIVERKSSMAAVYLAAVCEYLTAEVLELAGNTARDNRRQRITNRHIKIAIEMDEELNELYKDTVLAGGVLPYIHTAILPKKAREEERTGSLKME